MFFSFDGIDGVGKSTQLALFCDWLRQRGEDVVECRDPGSTPLGERVRQILLAVDDVLSIGRRSEMLLYMAARAQLVDEVIGPALEANKTVVSDRFLLANVVYQGHAGGLDAESLWRVGEVATTGVRPDRTFLLDMDPRAASSRLDRELDRMEQQGDDYRLRLREGFLIEARCDESITVINAARGVDEVQADIRAVAEASYGPWLE